MNDPLTSTCFVRSEYELFVATSIALLLSQCNKTVFGEFGKIPLSNRLNQTASLIAETIDMNSDSVDDRCYCLLSLCCP